MMKSPARESPHCEILVCAVLLLGVKSIRGKTQESRLVGLLLFVRSL